jgi:acyl carrier protein
MRPGAINLKQRKMELSGKILSIISQNSDCGKTVHPDDRIVEDLGIDSLDKLMIIHDLEDEFNITIDDEDLKGIKLVRDIVEACEHKLSMAHI